MKRTAAAVRALCAVGLILAGVSCAVPSRAETAGQALADIERLFLAGRYQEVIEAAGRSVNERSPRKDEFYYLAGASELKLGRYSDARASFQDIISECPGCARSFDAYVGLGDAYLLENNPAAAISVYENALAAFPDHKNTAVVYYRLGDAYGKAGDAGKSHYYFDSARMVAPLAFESKTPPVIVPRPPAPASAVAQARAAEPAPPARHVSIQVASFKGRENANRFVDRLTAEGFDSHSESAETPAGTVYRVRVGSFATKDDARGMIARLRSRGYAVKVCTDDICE